MKKHLLVIDAFEAGKGRAVLNQVTNLLWRMRRSLSADVIPVIQAESGYSPCGEGWTDDLRNVVHDAFDKTIALVPSAVRYSLSMLSHLSPADSSTITGWKLSLGIPALLSNSPKSLAVRSWIITSSVARARIFRKAMFGTERRISILGPIGKNRPAYPNAAKAVQPPVLIPGGILVVAGSGAMNASLGPVLERLRNLGKNDVQYIMSNQLPSNPSTKIIPAELVRPADVSTDVSGDARIMERIALAVGREILLQGRSQRLLVPILGDWLQTAPPRLLIVGNDRVANTAALVCAAKDLGIPSLSVQDGVSGDNPSWWTHFADWSSTSGAHLRDIRLSRGANENRIRITGQPRYDAFPEKFYEMSRLQARSVIDPGGVDCNPMILVVLQDDIDITYVSELLAGVLEVMKKRTLTVVIRPHPNDTMNINALLPRKMVATGRVIIESKTPVPIALRAANAVIGHYSTMLIEAVLMGIPTVSFYPSPMPVGLDIAAMGIAKLASSREELITQCFTVLDDPVITEESIQAAKYLIGPMGDNAADRVAQLALEISNLH